MKTIFRCLISALIFGCWGTFVNAQTFFDVKLAEHTDLSSTVIEGDVVAQRAWRPPNSNIVYTIYTINVYKEFKGKIEERQIEVKTRGGETEDWFTYAPHCPRLPIGKRGIFYFRNLKTFDDQTRHTVNFDPISYTKHGGRDVVDMGYGKIRFANCDLYDQIEQTTGRPYRQIAYTPEELHNANWLKEQGFMTLAASGSDASIEYIFEDEMFTGPNNEFLEFNIVAHTNALNSDFGHAEIRLKYDTTAFGSNVVANGVIIADKEHIILSNDYILNAIDVSANELMLTIDVTNNPLNLYELTQQPEDLIHVKVDISGVTNWGMVWLEEDSMYTDFYVPYDSIFSEVHDIIAQDSVFAAAKTSHPVGIEYTFENERVVAGPNIRLEFDVFITPTDTGTYFYGGQIYFFYNQSAFGSSIFANGKVTLTPGVIMNSGFFPNTYTLLEADNLANRYAITVSPISVFLPSAWAKLPNRKEQLLHVSIEVDNCVNRPQISFDQSLMDGQSFYSDLDSVNTNLQYSPLSASDFVNIPLCPTAGQPYISSVTPLKLSGGVGDTVTVRGVNFGTSPIVRLFNVQEINSSSPYDFVSSFYVHQLSDTLIKFTFPSSEFISSIPYVFGSGNVIVQNGSNSDTSLQPIEVNYSITNYEDQGSFYRPSLASVNGGGMEFRVDSSVANIPNAKACIERALQTWRCDTRVNFFLGADTTMVYSRGRNVGINSIMFAPDSILGAGTYASTYSSGPTRIFECGNTRQYYVLEIDIEFNRRYLSGPEQFKFDPLTDFNIGTNDADFTYIALHEFGHAHLLEHVRETNKVMFVYYNGGKRRRTLSSSEIDGGKFVMATNNRLNIPGCTVDSMVWAAPCWANPIDNRLKQLEASISPSPFQNHFTISKETTKDNWNGILLDLSGKVVKRFSIPASSTKRVIETGEVSKGVYVLYISGASGTWSQKVIKL